MFHCKIDYLKIYSTTLNSINYKDFDLKDRNISGMKFN